MKTKKVLSILAELKDEVGLNDISIGEDISTKKIANALDFAIEAINKNKKLQKKNEKLKEKVKELEDDGYERD